MSPWNSRTRFLVTWFGSLIAMLALTGLALILFAVIVQ